MRTDELVTKIGPNVDAQPAVIANDSDREGSVAAIVATFGDVDHEAEILAPGAVIDGSPVMLSSFGHEIISGGLPVGKGGLFTEGNHLVFRGQYFVQTPRGREAFEVLKALGGLAQWSWGFFITRSRSPNEQEQQLGAKKVITMTAPFEASPVVRGAGRNTRTLQAKAEERERQRIDRELRAMLDAHNKKLRALHPKWRDETESDYLRRIGAINP